MMLLLVTCCCISCCFVQDRIDAMTMEIKVFMACTCTRV